MKARNRIDNRIYAVKRIKLRNVQNDKIFREVNALSRLNHRFIVRYYTTWVETTEDGSSTANSDVDSSMSDTTEGMTSVPHQFGDRSDDTAEDHITTFDMNDLDSPSKHSFPSIHFGSHSGDDVGSSDSTSDSDDLFEDEVFVTAGKPRAIPNNGNGGRHVPPPPLPKPAARILYIQMVRPYHHTVIEVLIGNRNTSSGRRCGRFVTPIEMMFSAKSRLQQINEGLDEQNAWRLFHQILDALVHMSSLGIVGGP